MLLWNAGFPQELYRNFTEISSISHENTGLRKIPTIQRRQTDKQNQFLIKTNRAIES
jgi:hypothetical protein